MEQTVQRRVRIIPAKRDTDTPQPGKKKHQRVAAYCRVSTDSEELPSFSQSIVAGTA